MADYCFLKHPIPEGLEESERELFSKQAHQKIKIPEIRKLHNVFITHEGLVMKNGRLVSGCAFNLSGKEDNTFYYPFWRETIEKYAVCRWGKSLHSVHLKEPQKYLLIHSRWFNYAFWTNSFLVRLMMAENLFPNVKLLVPESWKNIPYVWDSLRAFDIQHEIIPDGFHIFVEHLLMPETRQWTSSFYPPHIQLTATKMLAYVKNISSAKNDFPEKIYLTRKKRGVRCVENEDEVILELQKFGFTPVVFEDMTIWEQILMMNSATHFISLHGAGFGNVMFMKPKAKVIELINKPYAELEYTFPYWKLSSAIGLDYSPLLCNITKQSKFKLGMGKKRNDKTEEYLVNSNIIVDINKLENLITAQIK